MAKVNKSKNRLPILLIIPFILGLALIVWYIFTPPLVKNSYNPEKECNLLDTDETLSCQEKIDDEILSERIAPVSDIGLLLKEELGDDILLTDGSSGHVGVLVAMRHWVTPEEFLIYHPPTIREASPIYNNDQDVEKHRRIEDKKKSIGFFALKGGKGTVDRGKKIIEDYLFKDGYIVNTDNTFNFNSSPKTKLFNNLQAFGYLQEDEIERFGYKNTDKDRRCVVITYKTKYYYLLKINCFPIKDDYLFLQYEFQRDGILLHGVSSYDGVDTIIDGSGTTYKKINNKWTYSHAAEQ